MKTIEDFAKLLEEQQIERLKHNKLDCSANIANARTKIIPGSKYTKVDVGSSGKYMVDRDGSIFGIKGYGKIHRGHRFGTLQTTDSYYWGDYEAVKRKMNEEIIY